MSEHYAWAIEFRSGSYLINADSDNGGTAKQAHLWNTMRAVDDFVTRNEWILMNGGCPVPICRHCRRQPLDRSVPCRCMTTTKP